MFKRTKISTGVLLALGGMLAAPSLVYAQETQRIEITGSSIKRIDAEGALPVQVITRDAISRSGATSTEELLNSLSSLSSAGSTVNATGAGASTYGTSEISLRGLESERTLVLVNGRRLAVFAGGGGGSINVNTIPLAAIDRIEVLNDGASAVYGSDAIAGVVNFILNKSYSGLELNATVGSPTRKGGGKSNKFSAVGGFGDVGRDGFNITLSAALEKDSALFGRERNFASRSTILPFFSGSATGLGNIQGAWIPGVVDPATGKFAAGTGTGTLGYAAGGAGTSFGNPKAADGACEDIRMFLVATPTSKGGPYCQYASAGDVGIVPKRDLATLSANLTFKLSENAELFGDVLLARSKIKQTFQPSPVRTSFLTSDAEFDTQNVDRALLVQPGTAAYTYAQNYLLGLGTAGATAVANSGLPFGVTSRVFDFGPRSSTDINTATRVVLGIRGTLLGQDYEVAVAHNENELKGKVDTGYFSQVAYAKVINTPGADWNPWSLTQTPALTSAFAAAAYAGPTLNAKSTSQSIDGKISGDLFKTPGGVAQYAYGAVVRSEKLSQDPSAALFTGDIAGLGGATAPVDRKREIVSAYSELNIPVVKGLEGNVAFRGDKYNDVGGSVTGKASLRWQPAKGVVLRASAGTGFRAPTLGDLWTPQTLGTSTAFDDNGQTDLQVSQLSGGNPALKPETSKQTGFGVVLQPFEGFSASVDVFRIKVNGIISTPSAQEVVSQYRLGNPAYQGLVTLDANGDVSQIIAVLSNTGTATVSGADLNVNYRHALPVGRLDLNLNGTYMAKFDQSTPGAAVSHKVGTIVDTGGNPVIGGDNGGVVLRWRHALTGTWSTDSWAFTLTQNFYKGYEDGNDLDGNRHFVPSQSIFDAQVAYTGIKNLKLAVGAKNLFDKNPPLYIPASNQFQAGFDINQYDPRARFVYVTAGYKFF